MAAAALAANASTKVQGRAGRGDGCEALVSEQLWQQEAGLCCVLHVGPRERSVAVIVSAPPWQTIFWFQAV